MTIRIMPAGERGRCGTCGVRISQYRIEGLSGEMVMAGLASGAVWEGALVLICSPCLGDLRAEIDLAGAVAGV